MEQLDLAVQKIVSIAHPEKLILFGSRGRGDNTEDSDWDFMVICDHAERSTKRTLYRAMNLPADIILVDKARWERSRRVPGTIYYDADTQGKVLHDRSTNSRAIRPLKAAAPVVGQRRSRR